MNNMNPNLMLMASLLKRAANGENILSEVVGNPELRQYLDFLEEMDKIDFNKPYEWPQCAGQDGYIKATRKLIGHTPWLTPIVTAVVLNERGQMLLERRSDDGNWSIPSGHMEPEETATAGAARELREEAGLIVEEADFRLFDQLSGVKHVYPSGDIIYSVKLIFIARKFRGNLETNYESTELKWFNLDQVPARSSGSTKRIAKMIQKRLPEIMGWSWS